MSSVDTENREDEDISLTQNDYNKALNNPQSSSDEIYVDFLSTLARGGNDQVLRYSRWSDSNHCCLSLSREWLKQSKQRKESIQNCKACGGKRKFEFQVLPQLLYYLQVDRDTTVNTVESNVATVRFSNHKDWDLDWGTLDVFSCVNSCNAGNGEYVEEVVIIQPPLISNSY